MMAMASTGSKRPAAVLLGQEDSRLRLAVLVVRVVIEVPEVELRRQAIEQQVHDAVAGTAVEGGDIGAEAVAVEEGGLELTAFGSVPVAGQVSSGFRR